MEYLVVIEHGPTSFGRAEALTLIRQAIEFYIEGLKEDGLPVPNPSSSVEVVSGVGT